jgi:predicted ArsR family transcriptional regulator
VTDYASEASSSAAAASQEPAPRLAVLKALGDNTRYAIYLELARSSRPLTTAEVAETLALHPNTVRPHLERMREVGLLEVETEARGAVGRPQHRYSLAADAPSLGLEPPTFPVLARMLLTLAGSAQLGAEEAIEAGREQGQADAEDERKARRTSSASCLERLVARLDALGFDPALVEDHGASTVAFLHCPFRELAEAHPDLVCGLHQGLVEGFVAGTGGARVTAFHSLFDRTPCQVSLRVGRRLN